MQSRFIIVKLFLTSEPEEVTKSIGTRARPMRAFDSGASALTFRAVEAVIQAEHKDEYKCWNSDSERKELLNTFCVHLEGDKCLSS